MAFLEYVEKGVKVTRREFLGILGTASALLWTGAYEVTDIFKDRMQNIRKRAQGIYKEDTSAKVRQSHNNRAVLDTYDKFLTKPLSPLAEELLHVGR